MVAACRVDNPGALVAPGVPGNVRTVTHRTKLELTPVSDGVRIAPMNTNQPKPTPYDLRIERAKQWLGNRYLLAVPARPIWSRK